jgi:hypothetical protein
VVGFFDDHRLKFLEAKILLTVIANGTEAGEQKCMSRTRDGGSENGAIDPRKTRYSPQNTAKH